MSQTRKGSRAALTRERLGGPALFHSLRGSPVRKTTVTYSFRDNASIPMIRLRGKWLELAGFREGQLVRVEVTEGRLTLTVAEADAT